MGERYDSMKDLERCFVMTVDVDSWSSLLNFYSVKHDPEEVESQTDLEQGIASLLGLFEKNKVKATFFVPGEVAKKHSFAVKRVLQYGHEIACHGFTHEKNECLLDGEIQRKKIENATRIIEEKIHVTPKGFRAPCLRANNDTLDALEEYGYLYDSSVIPTFIPGYYGSLGAQLKPYHPSQNLLQRKGTRGILEIPVSVNPIIPLPLSAAWMRNLGLEWVKFGIKANFLLGNPVVFYVHPRDVLSLPRVRGLPYHVYRNVGSRSIEMLSRILDYAKSLNAVFLRAIDLAILTHKAGN